MKEKKHIDELFKDRFKNFEVSPSPEVWGSIQASLDKRKKDRKLIPLWWKMGGVAALLALLFTIGNTVFNTSPADDTIVTSEENTQTIDINTNADPLLKDDQQINNIVSAEETENKELIKSSEEKIQPDPNSNEPLYNRSKDSKKSVAIETSKEELPSKTEPANTQKNVFIKDASEIIESKKEVVAVAAAENKKTSDKTDIKVEAKAKTEDLIKKDMTIDKANEAEVVVSKEETEIEESSEVETEVNKKSILDAIKEQEAIKSEEAVVATKNKLDRRWDVAPNFAPVYYNTLSSGSSIDESFSDNAQSGDVNFSYGVQVSYALSERLSVRSGVSNVDLSYATAGVELGTTPVSAALSSVNYEGKQTVLTAVDLGTIEAQSMSGGGFGEITPKATNGAAEIIQSISYYEVPLELKYSLLNRKFGVNVIGGLSTLFLGNNEVYVKAGDFESTLGEANNLTSVSFATNVGLGFDYKISKKFKFNIEPMFKYQLNPYTDSSVNFKPYYLGVYTGFSYKF